MAAGGGTRTEAAFARPSGMSDSVPAQVADRVRAAARDHCGYCLSPQRLVMARLEIEHMCRDQKEAATTNRISGLVAHCATGLRVITRSGSTTIPIRWCLSSTRGLNAGRNIFNGRPTVYES